MESISKEHPIIAYKAFNGDFSYQGIHYEIGNEYHFDGEIRSDSLDFHAYESPLEVLDNHRMLASRFAVVEQWGDVDRDGHKTIVYSSHIKVVREISLSELISCGIEWLLRTPFGFNGEYREHVSITSKKESEKIIDGGRHTYIHSSGCWSEIKSFGKYSKITSIGLGARIGSKGDDVEIMSSGGYAQIGSDGYGGHVTSDGPNTKIASDGNNVTISSSGAFAKICSIGGFAKISSSGEFSRIYSDGLHSNINSSGYYAKIKSVGEDATICSSGDNTYVDSIGNNAIVICLGAEAVAKAKKGSWITLTEQKYEENIAMRLARRVKTEYVDGERIKENTWYRLENGEFVEADYNEYDGV